MVAEKKENLIIPLLSFIKREPFLTILLILVAGLCIYTIQSLDNQHEYYQNQCNELLDTCGCTQENIYYNIEVREYDVKDFSKDSKRTSS